MNETEIQKFYKGANIFITGGTGFLGKILIDKLLRCTEINTLYLLIREKKGKNAHSRIDELFDDMIFDRLKKERPKFKHQVQAVGGDCSIAGLGLSITDRQMLISKIHVVFNVAATVRFDENLKIAYAINVNSAREVVEMSRQMTNLKSIIHVSTAYSNCPLPEVEEKFYDCPYSYRDVNLFIEKISKEEADEVTPRIIGKWPNTYTFTKALTESMLKDIGGGLPLGIFRPSIVISTYREPIPGWIDNLYGPTGIVAAALSGILRVMPCAVDDIADMVPVDTCVSGLICAAWDTAEKKQERIPENIPIYNYVSGAENPMTWLEFIQLNIIYGKKYPSNNALWTAYVYFVSNPVTYWLFTVVLHFIPAFFADILCILIGNKPRAFNMYRKIHRLVSILEYFSQRSWRFHNTQMATVWQKMSREDRELFPFSMTSVHWITFYRGYVKGIRRYLLKESDDNIESARKKDIRFTVIDAAFRYLLVCGIIYILTSVLSNLFHAIF